MSDTDPSTRDRVLHALSDATRRHLLKGIAEGLGSVAEISKTVAMSGPAISKHLHVLEDCGLIERLRNGRFHSFKVHRRLIAEAVETLNQILQINPAEHRDQSAFAEEVDVHLL